MAAKSTDPCRGCRDDFYVHHPRRQRVTRRAAFNFQHPCTPIVFWPASLPTDSRAFVEVKTYSCHHEPGRFAFYKELPSHAVDPVRIEKAVKR
jgi:hypothetical protein